MQGKAEHFTQVVRNLGLLPDDGSIEHLPLPDDSLQTLENVRPDIFFSLEERYATQRPRRAVARSLADRMRPRARSMRIELIEPHHLSRLSQPSSQWKQNLRLQLDK